MWGWRGATSLEGFRPLTTMRAGAWSRTSTLGDLDAGEIQRWAQVNISFKPGRSSSSPTSTRRCSFLHPPNLLPLASFKQPLVSPSQPQAPLLWVPPGSSASGSLFRFRLVPCRIPALLVALIRKSGSGRGAVRKCTSSRAIFVASMICGYSSQSADAV